MGKKRVVEKTEEEILKEKEVVEKALRKEVKLKKKAPQEANVYIISSYNNTILTLTTLEGRVLARSSAGAVGFKGTKKGTPYAASKAGEALASIALKMGVKKIHCLVKGIGSGRESALRALATHGLEILSIEDITPIPHNGCRPPRPRRV